MLVQSVSKGDVAWPLDVTDVRSRLAGLNLLHDELFVNASERIDDDLAFDGLPGVNDDCDRSGVELLLALLGLHISS